LRGDHDRGGTHGQAGANEIGNRFDEGPLTFVEVDEMPVRGYAARQRRRTSASFSDVHGAFHHREQASTAQTILPFVGNSYPRTARLRQRMDVAEHSKIQADIFNDPVGCARMW
jgi:hypothetical protein